MGCCCARGTTDDGEEEELAMTTADAVGAAPLLTKDSDEQQRPVRGVTRSKVNMNDEIAYEGTYRPCPAPSESALSRTTGALTNGFGFTPTSHPSATPVDRSMIGNRSATPGMFRNSSYRDRKPAGLSNIDARLVRMNRRPS
eukprot:TRINITY_DN23054_c0_g1_i1.p2 TRINITY_DN23054_c0_g1~~TRINITY_DN23054_c0_g1_i1.p2  ORF type:complete len:142 (+),score=35.89 TRINITY_DN23054_c0_g1_i1:91-516(+)